MVSRQKVRTRRGHQTRKAKRQGIEKASASNRPEVRASAKRNPQIESPIETKDRDEKETKEIETQIRNWEWITEREQKGLLPIWTMDIETDPFERDRVPVPFAVGLYDGIKFRKFWSDRNGSCLNKAKQFLEDIPARDRGIVYMHNGGRFDFFFLLDWFEGRSMIINSRIVRTFMPIGNPSESAVKNRGRKHYRFEFRDSFAIMPFPLAAYRKDEIEIWKLERDYRYKYRDEINSYLQTDCVALWELCMAFQREFGDYLTIASAAFNQLSSIHKFETLSPRQDEEIRKHFYFGGRVECFEKGIVEQPCKMYDVNSMYPAVMQNYLHPTSWPILIDRKIRWENSFRGNVLRTFFLTVEGRNYGAFPSRLKDGSVDFTRESGVFHVSIHEWNKALEYDLFKPTRIVATYNYSESSTFHQFVDTFFKKRDAAKKAGDKMHTLFYKFVLNSAYGKFALNPDNYNDWMITRAPDPPNETWTLDSMVQGRYWVWKRGSEHGFRNLKNIATAASVTGAARSILLGAIAKSKGVIYCDTDSIICSQFGGGELHDNKLGAWKLEGVGDRAAIAGKKLYAIFAGKECIKQANKGVNLTPAQIEQICRGENVMSFFDAPTFQRDGSAKFISRTARMT